MKGVGDTFHHKVCCGIKMQAQVFRTELSVYHSCLLASLSVLTKIFKARVYNSTSYTLLRKYHQPFREYYCV